MDEPTKSTRRGASWIRTVAYRGFTPIVASEMMAGLGSSANRVRPGRHSAFGLSALPVVYPRGLEAPVRGSGYVWLQSRRPGNRFRS
jgi:hypothetical protein